MLSILHGNQNWHIFVQGNAFKNIEIQGTSTPVGHIDGLVQDCSNSIADALELLQSCTKPSIWTLLSQTLHYHH